MPEESTNLGKDSTSQARRYILIFIPMIVLTIIAFGLAIFGALPFTTLAAILLVMAGIQFVLQVYLFMHLNVGRRAYRFAFAGGLLAAMIVWVALFVLLRF